ncbi:MAG: 3-isopropylmalate dehydrogenase [Rectinemataceae bacterium]|nr:3-isopropylmalate dehydrogenase [Rectinemataceae bacterium]
MKYSIAVVPGDGIGPDVIREALKVLSAIGAKYGHEFATTEIMAGGCAIDATGVPLPDATLAAAKASDAVLLGAVGGPKWDTLPGHLRPERALLGLRAGLGVFANLRPAALLPQLKEACPLKDEVVGKGFDLLIVRELTGGLYFGERGRSADGQGAWDTEYYSVPEIERVLRAGYRAALLRSKKLCVVDKANVLESSRLWREVAARVCKDYPEVETSYMYVDNCAMQLIRSPSQFDVIVTSNLFGDILSDEASVLTGSIGMLASASLGEETRTGAASVGAGESADKASVPAGVTAAPGNPARKGPMGLYEPIHGSAPDIAGKDLANPLATILSVAMMLRHSFGLETEASSVERAVNAVLDAGYRTRDIAGRKAATIGGAVTIGGAGASEKEIILGTAAMGDRVVDMLGK